MLGLGQQIVPLNRYTPHLSPRVFLSALVAESPLLACGLLRRGAAEHSKALICLAPMRLKKPFTIAIYRGLNSFPDGGIPCGTRRWDRSLPMSA